MHGLPGCISFIVIHQTNSAPPMMNDEFSDQAHPGDLISVMHSLYAFVSTDAMDQSPRKNPFGPRPVMRNGITT